MPDVLLAAFLILYIPAKQLWRSRRKPAPRPDRARLRHWWSTTGFLLLLLAGLALISWQQGRPASALGLDWPLSTTSLALIGVAIVLLAGLSGATCLWQRRLGESTPEDADTAARALAQTPFVARSRQEYVALIVMFIVLGIAWEVLYRGFLLLVLTPHTGVAGAVMVSAIAYGLAHGYQDARQCIGSIGAAFLFTIGYALSGSLWWLILIHIALPLSMLLVSSGVQREVSSAG